jgi:hypothetical protein
MNIKGFAGSISSLFTGGKAAVSSTNSPAKISSAPTTSTVNARPVLDSFTTATRLFSGPNLTGWDGGSSRSVDLTGPGGTPAKTGGTDVPVPQWMEEGQRPPWIPQIAWDHIPAESRETMLDGLRQRWTDHVEQLEPQWLQEGTRPPWLGEDEWSAMTPDQQQQTVAGARESFNASMEEEMGFYFGDVPEGGAPVDSPIIQTTQGPPWGMGRTGEWDEYGVTGNAVQYLNVSEMIGEGSLAHLNLCGQLAVISEVGGSLVDGLTQFAGLDTPNTDGADILGDAGRTTKAFQLEAFLRSFGYTILGEGVPGLDGVDHANPDGSSNPYNNYFTAEPSPEVLDTMLGEGNTFFAAVNIEGTEDGMLRPMDGANDDISHWVRVEDVSRGADGEYYVRVYNPYQNREEVYAWEDFTSAWSQTDGNNPYTYVAASPPPA